MEVRGARTIPGYRRTRVAPDNSTEKEMPDQGSQGGAGTQAGWVRDLSRARSEVGRANTVRNRRNLSRAHVKVERCIRTHGNRVLSRATGKVEGGTAKEERSLKLGNASQGPCARSGSPEKVELILKNFVLPLMGPQTEKKTTAKRWENERSGKQQQDRERRRETCHAGP